MDYTGKICPYCKTEFKEEDEVVVCSNCEMPHHKECWIENSACTTFGCTGTITGGEPSSEEPEQYSFCTQCGAKLKEEQKFCPDCGKQVTRIGEPVPQPVSAVDVGQAYQMNTPVTPPPVAPQMNTGYTQAGGQYSYGQTQPMDPEVTTFLGTNQETYLSKFRQLQMTGGKNGWNWCSFLFTGLWFAYRKMYGLAAIWVGVEFIASLLGGVGSMLNLAGCICAGIFGDYFYQQYVEKELQIARTMAPMNKAIYLAKKGGTSIGAVFAIMGIRVLILLLIGNI